MWLKIIINLMLLLMPTYANGDNEGQYKAPAFEGNETSLSDVSSSAYKWIHLSGNVTLVTNYIYRGQTQTFGGPAVQGEFKLSQKKDEGAYAGVWGSNVSSTTAPNGAGLELDLYVGYLHKWAEDFSVGLELVHTYYPGAHASLPTRDKFDTLEIIPSVSYKIFSLYFAYALTNYGGINQNLAPTFSIPLQPDGSSRGSFYTEAMVNLPVSFINDNLKLKLFTSYAYIKNYAKLNYFAFGAGLKYEFRDSLAGVSAFINASIIKANKGYYRVTNSSGKTINMISNKIWFGISKSF